MINAAFASDEGYESVLSLHDLIQGQIDAGEQ